MKYEIVEFKNGKYGIRRRNFIQNLFNFGGDFLDLLAHRKYFWEPGCIHFIDCQTSDLDGLTSTHQSITGNVIFRVIK